MEKPFAITLEEHPESKDVTVVRNGLTSYNESHVPEDNHRHLSIFLRDEDDHVVGGLLGGTYWGWLYVDRLWIDEMARGQGQGHALLCMAEEEAIRRGCHYVHLSSHSFQDFEFYKRHGYRKAGELPNLPPGHSKYLFWKELS
jgi:ribosomal protein S18 acetylase RimI-like enzyme